MTMHKGYDSFTPDAGTVNTCICKVCGSVMNIEKNCRGPTSYVEAIGKITRNYDHFTCNYSNESWHKTVLELILEKEKTASVSIKKMLEKEAHDLIKQHLE